MLSQRPRHRDLMDHWLVHLLHHWWHNCRQWGRCTRWHIDEHLLSWLEPRWYCTLQRMSIWRLDIDELAWIHTPWHCNPKLLCWRHRR